jgi:4-amino-4-deoxy-L-arabinose transferase-like glycosyltransferase
VARLPFLVATPSSGHWRSVLVGKSTAEMARAVSLLCFVAAVLCVYGTLKALLPARHPLLALVPLGIALLPPFADIMTAVNNDAAAVLFFSGFLMGMTYLLKQGFSLKWLLFALLMIALGIFTKRTTFLAVPLFLLFVPLVALPLRWRWLWWASVPALFLILAAAIFSWGETALWHRNAAQTGSLRVPAPDAVWGSHKLALEARPGEPVPQMTQFIPLEDAEALAGQVVTLGGWF